MARATTRLTRCVALAFAACGGGAAQGPGAPLPAPPPERGAPPDASVEAVDAPAPVAASWLSDERDAAAWMAHDGGRSIRLHQAKGPLAWETLELHFWRMREHWLQCIEDNARTQAGDSHATFTIGADGTVRDLRVDHNVGGDPAFGTCLRDALTASTGVNAFPASGGDTFVDVDLLLFPTR